jgi:hypothetical protein
VIRQDLRLMFCSRGWWSAAGRAPPAPGGGGQRLPYTILDELDLGREAANASQLRRNFIDSQLVYVPEVFWDYTCRNVMVMERIRGIPVTDLQTLRDRQVDLKLLGSAAWRFFSPRCSATASSMPTCTRATSSSMPRTRGIPATSPSTARSSAASANSDQYYLARNLLGIFRRDYHEVAQLHVECGWVPPETRVQDFESAMRAVCEPVFERPIAEISFGQLLVYLFSTAARFDMQVQPSLVLLQKTLLNIEGLGRQLYPELNLWDTAMPFLEKWMPSATRPNPWCGACSSMRPTGWNSCRSCPRSSWTTCRAARSPAPGGAAAAPRARRARATRPAGTTALSRGDGLRSPPAPPCRGARRPRAGAAGQLAAAGGGRGSGLARPDRLKRGSDGTPICDNLTGFSGIPYERS